MIGSGIARLDQDHADTGNRLRTLHAAVGRLQHDQGKGAIAATGEALAYFETTFVDHMAKEDRAVLPTLDAALGAWCLLPDWMRREHGDIRAKVVAVRQALNKAASGDPDQVR